MTLTSGSTPSFDEFNPDVIPYQREVIRLIRTGYDYNQGTLEILLSGAVGSAKSTLAAHVAVLHVLSYPRSRFLLGRRAMPDLRDTIFAKVLEHLEGTQGLDEGKHYWVNQTRASITFRNGSQIISRSWSDKKYKKMRSLELSGAIIEELTENDGDDTQVYDEIKMRIGRLPHVKENLLICCSNPGSPSSHWYTLFIASRTPSRRVYYSVTEDNPFLPRSYVESLKRDLDPKLARRMLHGEWIEITQEVVYYAYGDHNEPSEPYEINHKLPIWITWDFNIGEGKPLSAALFQYDDRKDTFHFFDEVVVHGMRTGESCDELAESGHLDLPCRYFLTGDAAGRARDTRSRVSDYDIIQKFFAGYRTKKGQPIDFQMRQPRSNPPVRTRHNVVNAHCQNSKGQVRLLVYPAAKMTRKGLRLTQLKKGGHLVEDDSKDFQHISTALGYGIMTVVRGRDRKPQRTIQL
jgi:hypothetical protein